MFFYFYFPPGNSSKNFEARNRRPNTASSSAARKTADDWLGLRPNSSTETARSHYEPSSSRGPSRRQDYRRQSTQQRTSRSAGLLFSDDDDDGGVGGGGVGGGGVGGGGGDRNATAEKKVGSGAGHGFDDLFADPTEGTAADPERRHTTAALSKRRETSPSIVTATRTNNAAGGTNIITYYVNNFTILFILRAEKNTPPFPSTTKRTSPSNVQGQGNVNRALFNLTSNRQPSKILGFLGVSVMSEGTEFLDTFSILHHKYN